MDNQVVHSLDSGTSDLLGQRYAYLFDTIPTYLHVIKVIKINIKDSDLISRFIHYGDIIKQYKKLNCLINIDDRFQYEGFYDIYICGDIKDIKQLDKLYEDLKKFEYVYKKPNKNNVNIVIKQGNMFGLKQIDLSKEINKTMNTDISLLYGKEFKDKIYDYTKEKLLEQDNGLVLFHGVPGTGKTSLIKNFISTLNKKIIYLPSAYLSYLDDPSFLPFAIDNFEGSVVVIEDADELLKKRIHGTNGAVSNLLNISDGILGHILKCSFVCTFNMSITDIDEALLRKGRLISKWEFKSLSKEEANALCKNRGLKLINKEATLAEIFNQKNVDFKEKSNKIGFTVN